MKEICYGMVILFSFFFFLFNIKLRICKEGKKLKIF